MLVESDKVVHWGPLVESLRSQDDVEIQTEVANAIADPNKLEILSPKSTERA